MQSGDLLHFAFSPRKRVPDPRRPVWVQGSDGLYLTLRPRPLLLIDWGGALSASTPNAGSSAFT
jgi:hypothetical protein